MPQKTLHLISLGCNKNLVDSEVMLGRLSDYALVDSPRAASVVIVNTCGFIQSAKQESIAEILRAASEKPKDAILVVTGCLSARYAEELRAEIGEIDIIVGVGDFDKIDSLILERQKSRQNGRQNGRQNLGANPARNPAQNAANPAANPAPAKNAANLAKNPAKASALTTKTSQTFLIDRERRVISGSKIHAYIKLSEGCNQQCSFCAIPSFKGRLRSRPIASILREVESLANQGFLDFSFIAQDSSSYLRDLGETDGLVQLIAAIEKLGITSARILYLYPSTTSEALIAKIAQSATFQPYFDLPLQHISAPMLKLMRRGVSKERHLELLEKMREIPGSFIRTSFIVGHPGESEADFRELCDFVAAFPFERVNIFAFSREEGTAAFDLPQVAPKIISKRTEMLGKIAAKKHETALAAYEGREIRAIVDGLSKTSEAFFSARDIRWDREIDGEILINENLSGEPLSAGIYDVLVERFAEGFLLGKALKRQR